MNRVSTDTLAALYPMESRRMIRNYAAFIEDYPEWVENGYSLMDYKYSRDRPEFTGRVCPLQDEKEEDGS